MSQGLRVGGRLQLKTDTELERLGIHYWQQTVDTAEGIIRMDDDQLRDGHNRWMNESGDVRVTTEIPSGTITEVLRRRDGEWIRD